jgi:hypothetical protein
MKTDIELHDLPEISPDRRRRPRYRFSVPLTIRLADGAVQRGISIEISVSGLSAITSDSLRADDTVELEPTASGKVQAVVRRNLGRVYGFEFRSLTAEQTQLVIESCKRLPVYQGNSLGI